jgi:hypothetical protein
VSPEEEQLAGGIANLGKVVRVGDTVRRPASAFTGSIVALLQHLHDVGFDHVPRPLGIDEQGREVWSFIEGDVPIPPFPKWSMSEAALVSVARPNAACTTLPPGSDASTHAWNDELCRSARGTGGRAQRHLPRRTWSSVKARRSRSSTGLCGAGDAVGCGAVMSMWGPVHDPSDPVPGMEEPGPVRAGRLIADAYGLDRRATRRGSGSSWIASRCRWWRN